jgi:PAS domain-containing protein
MIENDYSSILNAFNTILSLFESIGQAVFIFQDNRCIDCNNRASRIFNIPKKELIKNGPFAYSPPRQPDGRKSKDQTRTHFESIYHHHPLIFPWSFKNSFGSTFKNEAVLDYLQLFNKHYIFLILKDLKPIEKTANTIDTVKTAEDERSAMAARIEKLNQILKAMVENREIEKRAIEENNFRYFKNCILPYLDKMATCNNDINCRMNYHAIKKNLTLLNYGAGLTYSKIVHEFNPNEVKIIDLIRQGKRTKEIAEILKLSPSSISWYRNQIRNKLGLVSGNTNLRIFLNRLFSSQYPSNELFQQIIQS